MKNQNWKKRLAAFAAGAVLLAGLTGCVGEPSDTTTQAAVQTTGKEESAAAAGTKTAETSAAGASGEKIVRIGITAAPSGVFLQQLVSDDYNNAITNYIYEPLVGMDENAEYIPHLAKSWDVSEDNRTITFHLEEGVKWHDGEDFTADDVKFTFELMSDPEYAGLNTAYVSHIEGYDAKHSGEAEELSGVKVIDAHTVSITTSEVYASFLFGIAFSNKIIPEHYWQDVPAGKLSEATEKLKNPIGTGPFKLSKYVEGQYAELAKNADYWKAEPKLDKIVVTVVNTETSQAQVLNGEIDYLSLYSTNPDDNAIYDEKGFHVNFVRLNAYQQMHINTTYNELFGITEFRQALAYAINRQGIVDSLLYGYGQVANCPFQKQFWTYPEESRLNPYEYDPQKALEVLEAIDGITYDGTVLSYKGEPLKIKLTYPSGNLAREKAAVVIQQNLKDIGIDVELELLEFATLMERLQTGDFQMALHGNGAGLDPDTLSNYFVTGKGNNYTNYSNERVDELFGEAIQYLTNEERAPYYKEIAEILNHDLPTIFLYNWDQAYVTNPRVTGMTYSIFDSPDPSWNWDVTE